MPAHIKYKLPMMKTCVICFGTFIAVNRYQAARNKLCSDACKRTFISRLQKGRKHSAEQVEHLRAILKVKRLGSGNPMWRGDRVGYAALHSWVKRRFPKPNQCHDCGREANLDLANISQEYKRDLTDWEWLCRHCHMTKDGRMSNLAQFQGKGKDA